MALSLRTFRNRTGGTNGEIDPLRILQSVDPIASDFDIRVLFSGLWPTMQVETFARRHALPFATPNNGSASGTFFPSRAYAELPFAYASFKPDRDSGIRGPMIFGQRRKNVTNNKPPDFQVREMFQIRVSRVSSTSPMFRVDYEIDQNGGWSLNGTGRVNVIVVGKAQ